MTTHDSLFYEGTFTLHFTDYCNTHVLMFWTRTDNKQEITVRLYMYLTIHYLLVKKHIFYLTIPVFPQAWQTPYMVCSDIPHTQPTQYRPQRPVVCVSSTSGQTFVHLGPHLLALHQCACHHRLMSKQGIFHLLDNFLHGTISMHIASHDLRF